MQTIEVKLPERIEIPEIPEIDIDWDEVTKNMVENWPKQCINLPPVKSGNTLGFDQCFNEWRNLLNTNDISDSNLAGKVWEILYQKESGETTARDELRRMFEKKVRTVCNPRTEKNVRGDVEIIVDYDDGKKEVHELTNTVLANGKATLALSLVGQVNNPFDFYIDTMIFGTNGSTGDGTTARYVDESRTGLFGTTSISKGVISSIDPVSPTTAILTSVLGTSEGNGALSEMALVMANGQLYSMIAFPVLNKTSSMQLTINWRISLL
jgi:hypothetical protein